MGRRRRDPSRRPPPTTASGRRDRATGAPRLAGHAPSRRCRIGRDPASGAAAYRPPLVPPGATHVGHPLLLPEGPLPHPGAGRRCGAKPGAMMASPTPAARGHHAGAGLRRPCDTSERGPWGTGAASRGPQAGPRRMLRALPSRVVAVRPPRRKKPARAGGASSRLGWCSLAWRNALTGGAGSPGLGRGLCGFASRARGAQRPASGARRLRRVALQAAVRCHLPSPELCANCQP